MWADVAFGLPAIVKWSQPRCKRNRLVNLVALLRDWDCGKFAFEMAEQGTQGLGVKRGYTDGLVATTQQLRLGLRQSIAFIEDKRSPQHLQVQLLKNFHHGGNLNVDISRAGVHDMDQKICLAQFFEGRAKSSQQFFR